MPQALPRQRIAQAVDGFGISVKTREWHPSPRCQLQLSPYNLHNPPMRLRRRAAGIHHRDALRVPRSNCQIALTHASEKSSVLLLKAVFIGMMFVRILASTM